MGWTKTKTKSFVGVVAFQSLALSSEQQPATVGKKQAKTISSTRLERRENAWRLHIGNQCPRYQLGDGGCGIELRVESLAPGLPHSGRPLSVRNGMRYRLSLQR